MLRKVDPKVDCVFKAILGAEANRNLLIHFLNAVLRPPESEVVTEVVLLNPYNEKEFEEDKLSVVDVSVRDKKGRLFQVEIQLHGVSTLTPRILYGFCDLVASQLKAGENYRHMRPVITIWILNGTLIQGSSAPHHTFCLYDAAHGVTLDPQYQIHTLELPRWTEVPIQQELDRWVWFLRHAQELDPGDPPPQVLDTPEMRQAMDVLKRISQKEADYRAYQARMNYLRQQSTWAEDAEEARKQTEEYRKEIEASRREMEESRREAEELRLQAENAQKQVEDAQKQAEELRLQAELAHKQAEDAHQEIQRLRLLLESANPVERPLK